jgi:hypothetical protein
VCSDAASGMQDPGCCLDGTTVDGIGRRLSFELPMYTVSYIHLQ